LFLSTPKTSNVLFEAAPGIAVEFGQTALLKGQFFYNEDFQAYSNNSHLNTSLSRLGLTARYDDNKNKLGVDAGFQQADQATRDIRSGNGSLVHRDVSNASFTDEYLATEKTSFSVGATYANTDYKKLGYVDIKAISIPVKYYYQVLPKLDVSAGYRYRKNTLGVGGIDSTENFYSVGARGELTPKLTGELSVGVNQSRISGGGNRSGLGLDSSLTYAYTPKTSFTIGLNDGYSYSADGSLNKSSGGSVGVIAMIDANWRVNGTLAYNRFAYFGSGRNDDYYMAQLAATYTYSERVSFTAGYAYSDNSSSLSGGSFTDNILSVSTTFKF
jgi:hypothetical protein